jgi:hypothetical protein
MSQRSWKTALAGVAVVATVGMAGLSGCGAKSVAVPSQPAIVSSSDDMAQPAVATADNKPATATEATLSDQPVVTPVETVSSDDESGNGSAVAEATEPEKKPEPETNAPGRVRDSALAQFGGLGGGGLGGGGMLGGGGGMMGGGGGMGGLGGGGGGGAAGVSIDPKIRLKSDRNKKLDERRKESLSKTPETGKFSTDQR